MPRKTEVVEMPESLAFSPMTENTNNVQKRTWRKWNNQARYIFNEVYLQFEAMQSIQHPRMPKLAPEHWQTIRWNAAWIAADAATHTIAGGPTLEDATTQVFVPMLQSLYEKAGLKIPSKVYPGREVKRLIAALKTQGG